MHLPSFPFLGLALLAAAPAADDESPIIAFPKSAGEAEFVGLAIVEEGGRCRVKESTGSAESDAFACRGGPRQKRRIGDQIYAMTWQAPPYRGTFVRASLPPSPGGRVSKPPGTVVRTGPDQRSTLIDRLLIDEKGRVIECAIESSSGDPLMDARICEYAKTTLYRPATLDGVPVAEVRYEVETLIRRRVWTTHPL